MKTTYNMLKQEVREYALSSTDDITQAIYIIDDLMIDGEFDCGFRGIDHNALLCDGITWEDLLNDGIVIVPETSTYISDIENEQLEQLYTRLPLNNNHIVGYKEEK